MNIGQVLGILAGVLSFSAYILYIYSTIYGYTRPNRATWWILTLIGSMIALSYYSAGARDTIWISFSYVLGPFIIAVLSLKYGEGRWERLDKICLTGAILSAIVWYLSSSAVLALIMNIFIDFIGLLPTIKKSYLRPEGEDRKAWTLESVASGLNIFAIEKFTLGIVVYPVYLLTLNVLVTVLLYRKK